MYRRPDDFANLTRLSPRLQNISTPHPSLENHLSVIRLVNDATFLAMPTISRLRDGSLLVAIENHNEAVCELHASRDNGLTWQFSAEIHAIVWPQLFTCSSGTYVLGTSAHYSRDSGVIISKMLDDEGVRWTPPRSILTNYTVVLANTGVEFAHGFVVKGLEIIPSLSSAAPSTVVAEKVTFPRQALTCQFRDKRRKCSTNVSRWVKVDAIVGFVENTILVTEIVDVGPVHWRLLEIDTEDKRLLIRFETYNLLRKGQFASDVVMHKGLPIATRFHSEELKGRKTTYAGFDWIASAIYGKESEDLTLSSSWTLAQPVGNPLSALSNEVQQLLGTRFRSDMLTQ